jgi:hypothetical protein
MQCAVTLPSHVLPVYEAVRSAVYLVVPYFMILTFNSFKALTLHRRKAKMATMTSQNIQNKDEAAVSVMVIAVTFVFLVLLVPYVLQNYVCQAIAHFVKLNEFQFQLRFFSQYLVQNLDCELLHQFLSVLYLL